MAGLIRLAGGLQFEPHLSGALFWRAAEALIVADLHFEAAPSLARRGRRLPSQDAVTTLTRLETVVERYRPAQVICLGGNVHDSDTARMSEEDTERLARLCAGADWIWVRGAPDSAPPPLGPTPVGGRAVDSIAVDGVQFRHVLSAADAGPEISGYFHPKATVPALGRNVTRPCFVYDARRVVLPSFGVLTGGLNVRDSAFLPRFPDGFDVALLGARKLHWFSARDIAL